MKTFSSWKNEEEEDDNLNENMSQSNIKSMFSNSQEALRNYLQMSMPSHLQSIGRQDHIKRNPQESAQTVRESNFFDTINKEKEQEKVQENLSNKNKEIEEEKDFYVENEEVEADDLYKLYKDREETFECNISIEGASLASAQARLVIDTNELNLIFYGKLYKDGRCLVQLKKMTHLTEGIKGRIRLEVIVDDTLFVPWESACTVDGFKKVKVDIKGKKSVTVNLREPN